MAFHKWKTDIRHQPLLEMSCSAIFKTKESNMTNDRFEQGKSRLAEIDGKAGADVIDGLTDLAPDLGRYIVDFGFGQVYSRPALDLQTREQAKIATMTERGNIPPHLGGQLAGG